VPYRNLASTVVGILILAIIGAVTGPAWDPVPMSDQITVQASDTSIGGAPAAEHYEVRTRLVTVQLDGASVEAQISEPVGAPGLRPAVVFVHGAGTGTFAIAFLAQAQALAASGTVAMVPNKRLGTYTTENRDYVAMAGDYLRSVDLLRTQPGVDPARVGLYGESEGGWIVPVMAARDRALAFVILVSAGIVPPRQQAAFATDAYLRKTGVPGGVFRAIPRAVGIVPPGGGFEYVDFDVTPYLRQMLQPVLIVYGTEDASMPTVQGAEKVITDTALAGNENYTVRYYGGANHGIRVDGEVSQKFLKDLTGWVAGLPATGHSWPRIAGAQPIQTFAAGPLPTPRWLRSGDVIIASVLVGAGLIALGPALWLLGLLAGALMRRTGRTRWVAQTRVRLAPGLAAPLVAVCTGAVVTVAALVWYLFSIAKLAINYGHDVWVVTGGWLALRALGIAIVVAGVVFLDRLRAERRGAGVPVAGGILGSLVLWVPVAGAVLLLGILAYWGIYQLGI
jgi:dienelactone hydrolase